MNRDPGHDFPGSELPWDDAHVFLKRCLAGRLTRIDEDELNDLTQEALVRLLRSTRREPARSLEALMTEIAHRTAVDFIRRRRRWSVLVERTDSYEDVPDPRPTHAGELGDPVERIEFTVLEFFRSMDSPCGAIAAEYFERRGWPEVAARLGQQPATIRKRWSRCVEALRRAARENPAMLFRWSDEEP